jgi:hypothetical protein
MSDDNSPGDDTLDKIEYYTAASGPGGLIVARNGQGGTADDLKQEVKTKLGSIINRRFIRVGSEFPIPAELAPFAARDEHGRPAQILTNNPIQRRFINQGTIDSTAVNRFENHNDSSRVPRVVLPNTHKGRSSARTSSLNGNQLLSQDIQGIKETILLPTLSVLSRNRFTDERKFTSLFENNSDSGVALAGFQPTLGKYQGTTNEESPELKMEDLKKVALIMLMEASGKPDGLIDGRSINSAAGLAALSFTPGLAQLGVDSGLTTPNAAEALHKIHGSYNKQPNTGRFLQAKPRRSFGSPHNQENHFAGASSFASIPLAIAMITAFKATLQGISIVLDLANKSSLVRGIAGGASNLINPPGQTSRSSDTKEFGGRFFEFVEKGLNSFFAWDGQSYLRVAINPSYYILLIRNIIRSETVAIEKFGNIGSVTDALGAVENLLDSKIFGFMKVMAKLGQAADFHEGLSTDQAHGGNYVNILDNVPETMKIPLYGNNTNNASETSVHFQNPFIHVLKTRTNDGKMAWQNSSSRSAYLLPTAVLKANQDLGNGPLLSQEGTYVTSNSRISKEDREQVEQILDAEYVPFYFHDLRTNEIISFHAFLESLSDSFAVEHESSSGYGRVGKVSIYKNTNRSVSMSFFCVATNEKDFDQMYQKINKLVTMIYPQWTEGRQVKVGNRKFTQPFSQVPGASPMIRLRLGDIFKTNYSKFAAARLFGLGNSSFQMNTNAQQTQFNASVEAQKMASARSIPIEVASTGIEESSEVVVGIGDYFKAVEQGNEFNLVAGRGNILSLSIPTKGRILRRTDFDGGFEYIVNLEIPPVQEAAAQPGHNDHRANARNRRGGAVAPAAVSGTGTQLVKVVAPRHSISLSPEELNRRVAERFATQGPPSQTEPSAEEQRRGIQEFFGNDNPVIKSFASTEGKGMPGFITSLSFNWKDGPWETSTFNSIAPMMCKIDINFEPVFDIAPGLDHNGFDRAPVYNVGTIMQSQTQNGVDKGEATFNNSRRAATRATTR